MKKFSLVILVLLLILCSGCHKDEEEVLDGQTVRYDSSNKQFLIEENGHLKVAVKNEEYGEALVSLWNEIHPEYAGYVEYKEPLEYTAINYWTDDSFDLMYIDYEEVPLLMGNVYSFDEELVESMEDNLYERELLVNKDNMIFVPMEYQGFLCAYNKALLDNSGIDVKSIDSFENLMSLMDSYSGEDIFCFYPLSFKERYTLYPLLTAGGFNLFSSNYCEETGFDSEEFLDSLQLIYELGNHNTYTNTKLAASELPYALDAVLADNDTLVTLISNLMPISENEDYVFTSMPTYKGNTLSPLCDLYGYAISSFTDCPSAASELLRIIRSEEGMKAYIDNTDAIPYVKDCDNLTGEKKEKALAYQKSVTEPIIALTNDSTKRAWDMYYEIDFLPVLRALYDHQINPEKAQKEIVELANTWLIEKGIELNKENKEDS